MGLASFLSLFLSSEQEAERMLESMQDLLSQQQQMGRGSNQAQMDSQPAVFKRPTKPPRRLSKKDISSPCNFKHVSGIYCWTAPKWTVYSLSENYINGTNKQQEVHSHC